MNDDLTRSDLITIGKILKSNGLKRYNVDKKTLSNVNNVDSDKERLLSELLALYKDKPEGIAKIIAERLGDLENLNFHIKVAKQNNPHVLFEALAIAEDARRQGRVKGALPSYYVGILKRKGIRW